MKKQVHLETTVRGGLKKGEVRWRIRKRGVTQLNEEGNVPCSTNRNGRGHQILGLVKGCDELLVKTQGKRVKG